MTSAASPATLAVSHLCRAFGPWARGPGPRMSAAVRGAGVMTQTAPTSAIRLRVRTSPWDSRPSCCGTDAAALRAARGRSSPGRIRIPLPSGDTTTTSPGPACWRRAAGIKAVEVAGGRPDQLLRLPGPQPAPGLPLDLHARLLQRASHRLRRGHLRQPVRMLPWPAGPAAHPAGAPPPPPAPGTRSGTPPPARRCWPAPGSAPARPGSAQPRPGPSPPPAAAPPPPAPPGKPGTAAARSPSPRRQLLFHRRMPQPGRLRPALPSSACANASSDHANTAPATYSDTRGSSRSSWSSNTQEPTEISPSPSPQLPAEETQRWAIETGLAEFKTYLRGPGRILRSRTPPGPPGTMGLPGHLPG